MICTERLMRLRQPWSGWTRGRARCTPTRAVTCWPGTSSRTPSAVIRTLKPCATGLWTISGEKLRRRPEPERNRREPHRLSRGHGSAEVGGGQKKSDPNRVASRMFPACGGKGTGDDSEMVAVPRFVRGVPTIVAAFGRMWRDRSGSRGGRARGTDRIRLLEPALLPHDPLNTG